MITLQDAKRRIGAVLGMSVVKPSGITAGVSILGNVIPTNPQPPDPNSWNNANSAAYQRESEYQRAKARYDYEKALEERRKETNIKVIHGSNGWIVEVEGQPPWICKDIEEIGATISAAMGVKVLNGGTV